VKVELEITSVYQCFKTHSPDTPDLQKMFCLQVYLEMADHTLAGLGAPSATPVPTAKYLLLCLICCGCNWTDRRPHTMWH